MDAKSPEFKAAMSAIRERIATTKRRETSRGYIDYHVCRNICHEFQKLLKETVRAVEFALPKFTSKSMKQKIAKSTKKFAEILRICLIMAAYMRQEK
ncbi:MAG: hypothetical protein FWC91_09960 [Defluviitaleaceae bacterium]|nr:hypothetical protein [Defluviitaleaceae bacterium]